LQRILLCEGRRGLDSRNKDLTVDHNFEVFASTKEKNPPSGEGSRRWEGKGRGRDKVPPNNGREGGGSRVFIHVKGKEGGDKKGGSRCFARNRHLKDRKLCGNVDWPKGFSRRANMKWRKKKSSESEIQNGK